MNLHHFRVGISLLFTLCLETLLWSAPSIQSVNITPNPLLAGHNIDIKITTSADAIQAIAVIDFRPAVLR